MRLGPPVFHPGSLPQSNCPLPPKERSDAELSETAPDLTALGPCRNRRGYRHNRATNRNSLRGIRAQSQRERKFLPRRDTEPPPRIVRIVVPADSKIGHNEVARLSNPNGLIQKPSPG